MEDAQMIYEEYEKMIKPSKIITEKDNKNTDDNKTSKPHTLVYKRDDIKFAICSENIDSDIRSMKAYRVISDILSNPKDKENIKLLAIESFMSDRNWYEVKNTEDLKDCLIINKDGKIIQEGFFNFKTKKDNINKAYILSKLGNENTFKRFEILMRVNVPFIKAVRDLINNEDVWHNGIMARYEYLQNILNK
jgi:hypothetical protein